MENLAKNVKFWLKNGKFGKNCKILVKKMENLVKKWKIW